MRFHGPLPTSAGRHAEGIRINTDYVRTGKKNTIARNPLDVFIAWNPMPNVSPAQLDKAETDLIRQTNPAHNVAKKKKPTKP
jgi:hypothetical protein